MLTRHFGSLDIFYIPCWGADCHPFIRQGAAGNHPVDWQGEGAEWLWAHDFTAILEGVEEEYSVRGDFPYIQSSGVLLPPV